MGFVLESIDWRSCENVFRVPGLNGYPCKHNFWRLWCLKGVCGIGGGGFFKHLVVVSIAGIGKVGERVTVRCSGDKTGVSMRVDFAIIGF